MACVMPDAADRNAQSEATVYTRAKLPCTNSSNAWMHTCACVYACVYTCMYLYMS